MVKGKVTVAQTTFSHQPVTRKQSNLSTLVPDSTVVQRAFLLRPLRHLLVMII